MPDNRDARKKLKIAIAALLAVDVIATVVLFSPLVGSERLASRTARPVVEGVATEDPRDRTAAGFR